MKDEGKEPVKANSKVITTQISKVWMGEDGICRVVLLPGVDIGLEEMKESVAARNQIIENGKAPVLVEMREIKSMSAAARRYGATVESTTNLIALALLESSAIGKMVGNFFINFNRAAVPRRLFNSEAEALAWLKGFLE